MKVLNLYKDKYRKIKHLLPFFSYVAGCIVKTHTVIQANVALLSVDMLTLIMLKKAIGSKSVDVDSACDIYYFIVALVLCCMCG